MDTFGALAEPRRRKIIELIAKEGQLPAGQIYRRFNFTAQAVSQHLRILLETKILRMEKRAQQHIYSLNPDFIDEMEHWTRRLHAQWNESLDRLDKILEEQKKDLEQSGKMTENTEQIKELTITRTLDAPVNLVWKAWMDPKLVAKWWGPRGVTSPICEWDVRPGGGIYIVMLAGKELGPAEGMRWPMKGTFTEVVPQSRLVYTSGALDDVDRSSNTFIEQTVTVEFEDQGEKTGMYLHIVLTKTEGPKAPSAIKGMTIGWNQQMDKLSEELHHMSTSGR